MGGLVLIKMEIWYNVVIETSEFCVVAVYEGVVWLRVVGSYMFAHCAALVGGLLCRGIGVCSNEEVVFGWVCDAL